MNKHAEPRVEQSRTQMSNYSHVLDHVINDVIY